MTRYEGDAVADAYAATAVNTVSRPMLLVKLYDRLAFDIELAAAQITDADIASAHETLIHAQRIVRVLRTSLQEERFRGGAELMGLYETLEQALIDANLNKDVGPLELCRAIVTPLASAWTEAARLYAVESAEESPNVAVTLA